MKQYLNVVGKNVNLKEEQFNTISNLDNIMKSGKLFDLKTYINNISNELKKTNIQRKKNPSNISSFSRSENQSSNLIYNSSSSRTKTIKPENIKQKTVFNTYTQNSRKHNNYKDNFLCYEFCHKII